MTYQNLGASDKEKPPTTGFVIWLTGLSGAGKSTIATALAHELRSLGTAVEILDGDEVRTNLSKGLGFSKKDRDTNVLRIGYVARLLARNGVGVITAAISPYAAIRKRVRHSTEGEAHFIEVHVDCSITELHRRDTKGLYKQAQQGKLANLTGVSDPYEPPNNPDIYINTEQQTVTESINTILTALLQQNLISIPASD